MEVYGGDGRTVIDRLGRRLGEADCRMARRRSARLAG
ncbi:hypothetical protein GA0115258_11901, partial [Streptomyces sp. LamerLS-31b]